MPEDLIGEIDAIVAGYIGVDLTPRFPQRDMIISLGELLQPGKLVETDGLTVSLGGAVANTGLAMQAFGKRVCLNALIGEDILGDIVMGLLKQNEAALSIRRTGKAGTGYGIVLAPPGIDRIFLESPGANSVFCPDDIDYDVAERSRLFHFGYPTLMKRFFENGGAELVRMFKRVKGFGVLTSMDMSLPDSEGPSGKVDWRRVLENVLPHVDVFVPSIEELLYMMDLDEYLKYEGQTEQADFLHAVPDALYCKLAGQALEMGVKVIMIKAGHRGVYLRTAEVQELDKQNNILPENWNNKDLWVSAFPVDKSKVKNACGAGDASAAAFLTALLDGETIEHAGKLATLAGRDNLYGIDAISGLSTWEVMKKKL